MGHSILYIVVSGEQVTLAKVVKGELAEVHRSVGIEVKEGGVQSQLLPLKNGRRNIVTF